MTQVNPEQRASADTLLTDPFISDACIIGELEEFIEQIKLTKNQKISRKK